MAAPGDKFVGAETGVRSDQFEDYHNSSLRASWARKMGIGRIYKRHNIPISIATKGTGFGSDHLKAESQFCHIVIVYLDIQLPPVYI